jgi:hypothetical protein
MEVNQFKEQDAQAANFEPTSVDNSNEQKQALVEKNISEGKSKDPELILGKFKSTEDLTKAYQELEKLQGSQSSELGTLRENLASMRDMQNALSKLQNIFDSQQVLQETAQKYKEYFQDPSFRELYTEAYRYLGSSLDTERLVNLVEAYTTARINAYEKLRLARSENQKATGGMKFDKNDKNTQTPVKKSIQEMTPKELDELLDRLI